MITLTKKTISVDDWYDVSDCPIQRDTERHALKAIKNHLKKSSETHKNVSAAILPDGSMYKLDGHTRSHLWKKSKLIPPFGDLNLDLYKVDNLEEVNNLYKQFDSTSAVETSSDRLTGAYRENNFIPNSQILRSGGVHLAIKIINNKNNKNFNIYEEIKPFIDVLRSIDEYHFIRQNFPAYVLAAMIITVIKEGDKAFDFWIPYNNDEGIKRGKKKDGVQALTEIVRSYRDSGQVSMKIEIARQRSGKAISCFNSFMEGSLYSGGVKGTDLDVYIKSLHQKKYSSDSNFYITKKINEAIKIIKSGKSEPSVRNLSEYMEIPQHMSQTILYSLLDMGILEKNQKNQGYRLIG